MALSMRERQAISGPSSGPSQRRRGIFGRRSRSTAKNLPDRTDFIDGALGELSQLHAMHGFYVHGVSVDSATFPTSRERGATSATASRPTTSP